MEDDPREVDWAERHIRKLEEGFESLRRGLELIQEDEWPDLTKLKDRVKRLEGQTQFEATEDYDRIKGMEAAVRELQSAVASMRSQQDFMIGEGHGEPFEVWCRRKINSLADGFDIHTRLIEKTEERLDGLEGHPRRDPYDSMKGGVSDADEFARSCKSPQTDVDPTCNESGHDHTTSSCLGPVEHISEADDGPKSTWLDRRDANEVEERRRTLVEAMKDKRVTFRPGLADETPLIQAEVRVRDYMGNHFSTATIEGVVRALRGKPETPVRSEDARAVATRCPGFGQCYASDKLHWHDKHWVVHID